MAEDIRNAKKVDHIKEFNKEFVKPYCIVLDSQYCSMGRMIGYQACNELGYSYYDSDILLDLVKESGLTKEDIDKFECKLRTDSVDYDLIKKSDEYKRIDEAFAKAIDIALAKGPCLIHDRACKEKIIQKGYTCISVLNYANDINTKLVRAAASPLYCDINDKEELVKKIQEEDNIRINWHSLHSDSKWGDINIYDLCLNAEALGKAWASNMLVYCVNNEH